MNNVSENDFDLALEIGELKGLMTGVAEKLERQNGSLLALQAKVQKHDLFIGKMGLMIAGFVFLLSTMAHFIINWVAEKFTK